MKKLNNLIITFLLISSLPQNVKAQLTEAGRQKQCNNNKIRLADRGKQLAVVNSELSAIISRKQIEHEKDNMVFVRKIKTKNIIRIHSNGQDIPIYILSQDEEIQFNRTITEYNFSGCAEAKQGSQYSYHLEYCLEDLYKIIAKKVDKAELLIQKRPKLLQQKSSLEKQITFHRNNLIALRCNESSIAQADNFDYSKISGTWQSDWGPVQLNVSNSSVSGSWKKSATETGQITGGSFDEITGKLQFTFVQGMDKKTGTATLYLTETPTAYKLQGDWRLNDGSSGELKMRRSK